MKMERKTKKCESQEKKKNQQNQETNRKDTSHWLVDQVASGTSVLRRGRREKGRNGNPSDREKYCEGKLKRKKK